MPAHRRIAREFIEGLTHEGWSQRTHYLLMSPT